MDTIIEVRDLRREYTTYKGTLRKKKEIVEAVRGISFTVNKGEIFGLLGQNGAGKTTLLKIIMGEMSADDGEVIISKGKTIGYLAQHQDTDSDNTIYDEVLEAKKEIIAMEEKIRRLEKEMKNFGILK